MGFSVEANEINKYANYLIAQVVDDVRTIKWGAIREGINTEGFTGVLEVLVGPMEDFHHEFHDIAEGLVTRLENMAETLKVACKQYGNIDEAAERDFQEQQARERYGENGPPERKIPRKIV